MARRREEQQSRLLERGSIAMYYRPRVERFDADELGDMQRLLIVLSREPAGLYRVIAVGRKEMAKRFWGFVDLVLHSRQDLNAALGAQIYRTKRRGIRHLPAAQLVSEGQYEICFHEDHAHLRWDTGDFIVTVMNPDPTIWNLAETPPLQLQLFDEAELHVTIPTPFPPRLQAKFGDRRYMQLESTEFLDHPGAELVFIAGHDSDGDV